VAWAVWAAWTIKPTLNPNDEGPDLFRAFFLLPRHGKMHRFAGAKNASVMLAKKAAELSFFFLAKIAFQLNRAAISVCPDVSRAHFDLAASTRCASILAGRPTPHLRAARADKPTNFLMRE
jgi:hypothetical protein